MGIFALLLVSAGLHLFNLAACDAQQYHTNLRDIIVQTEKFNETTNPFVEDVQDLVEEGCPDDFFCKVLGILKKQDITKHIMNESGQKILRNLAMFVKVSKMKCEKKPKTQENAVQTPLTVLLGFLKDCSRRRISFQKTRASDNS